MALSDKARQVLEIALAHKPSSTEVADAVDSSTAAFSDTSNVAVVSVMSEADRDALDAPVGKVIFNTDAEVHQGYDGTVWNNLY